MKRKTQNNVYLNPKQIQFLEAPQKDKTIIAGRGFGKTTLIGAECFLSLSHLPRSREFFCSSTFAQLLTKTLPPIIQFWESMGLKEHRSKSDPGHFVVGKKPPVEWETPYSQPRKFDNVISFYTGNCIELLSMDRPDLQRGGSYDRGHIDECALVEKDHIDKILLPSIRGNRHRFKSHMHQQLNRYSSMPWLLKGKYLLNYEDKAKQMPNDYYYLEATAYDNIDVLGEEGIERLKREMSYLIFEVEVMNQRIGRSQYGFYNKFDESVHCYRPSYKYDHDGERPVVVAMTDRNTLAAIDVSFDFSGYFKGVVCFQLVNNTEYMRASFHRKEDGNIDQVVDDMCIAMADQVNKHVNVYGEPRGHDKQATGPTIYERIRTRFIMNGWKCEVKVTAQKTEFHEIRYEYINDLLSEEDPRLPKLRINEVTCKDVIISMLNAEVTTAFKKVKKDEENRSFNQAHATHFTDMVDYFFVQKYYYKLHMGAGLPGRGSGRVN